MTRVQEPTERWRVAMVAACPFPSLRGSQVLIQEVAHALAERGHEVHLVTYAHGENLVPFHGVFVHRIRAPRFATRHGGFGWRRFVLDLCLGWTLYRVVRSNQIQVIHAHNYEAPIISYFVRLLTKVPVVYHAHNALSDELGHYVTAGWRRALASRFGSLLDGQVPRRADFSIALTAELEGFLSGHGVRRDRLAVVAPNAPAPIPPRGAVDGEFDQRFTVMYTGNLDPYQDLDVLFDAFGQFRVKVSDALLVVVTHEPDWARRIGGVARELIREGALRVVPASTFSVVRRMMTHADILVCPRSSWSGFPVKLLNYLAAGRPVVCAEGSAKVVADGETALVFRNRDSRDLALALWRLSDDAALRERLSAGARALAGAFARHLTVTKIEQIYASCVPTQSDRLFEFTDRRRRAQRLLGAWAARISTTST